MIFDRGDQLWRHNLLLHDTGGSLRHKYYMDVKQLRWSGNIILIETMEPVPIEIGGCDLARTTARCSVNTDGDGYKWKQKHIYVIVPLSLKCKERFPFPIFLH